MLSNRIKFNELPVNLKEADTVVGCLYSAMKRGESNLGSIPGLLLRIINENFWQKRIIKTGETVEFNNFVDFVTTKPLAGLGESLDTLKKLCHDDPQALDAIDRVTVNSPGKTWDSRTQDKNNVDNINNNFIKRPTGTSKEQALRRLRKSRPDLHKKVLNKEISAHRAMIEAGFRKIDTPFEIIEKQVKKLSKEEMEKMILILKSMINKDPN